MRHRTTVLVVAVVLLGCAAVVVPGADATAATQTDEFIQDCAAEPPDDFDAPSDGNEVIGWVDGYWYNQPLSINATGGLNESEVEQLSARTAARFEVMRCLPAEEGVPPVEIKSRDEFASEQEGVFDDIGADLRLAENARLETMLIVGSNENATDVREQNRASTIGGTYNFRTDTITIVSDSPDSLLIDEEILVHEIGHAVQDQQFNLTRYERPTTDIDKGVLSLIEGDVTFIENRYLDACENERWEEPCVSEDFGDGEGGGSNEPANWGLYFTQFQPYSDGPSLIQGVFDDGGWDAVNALYDDPPQSAYFSAFPGTYGEVELQDVEVPDRSTDDWERLTFEDEPDHDTIGVAGISAMFKTPTYESGGTVNIYDPQDILNTNPDGTVDDFNPLNYNQIETEGWRDDKFYTYRNADNETGAVWETAWATPQDAEPFLEAYQQLVDYRNGQRVDGYEYTYTFGEDSAFDMALTIVPDGDRVTIVTAPSVEELTEIHQDIELVEEQQVDNPPDDDPADDDPNEDDQSADDGSADDDGSTGDDGAAGDDGSGGDDGSAGDDGSSEGDGSADDDGSGGGDGSADNESSEDEDSADDSGAGFGVAIGVVALLAAALLAVRRQ